VGLAWRREVANIDKKIIAECKEIMSMGVEDVRVWAV